MLPAMSLLCLALLARFSLGSWAAPGAFFAAVWFVYITVSLALSPFPALDEGLWWMVLSIFCLYLGNLLAIPRHVGDERPTGGTEPPRIFFPGLPAIVLVCLLMIIFYYIWLMPVYVLPDPSTKPPLWVQFFLAAMYALPFFCGLLFASTDKIHLRLLGLVNFPLALIMGAEFAGRSTVPFSLIFWFSTYMAVVVMRSRGMFRLFTMGRVLILVGSTILVVTSLTISSISRLLKANEVIAEDRVAGWQFLLENVHTDSIRASLEGIQSSTVGSVASFTWWFDGEWSNPTWTMYYLAAMFSGPLEQLGFVARDTFTFDATYFDDGTASNVYTLFRPLIQAFTLPGSLLVLLGLGWLAGRAYIRVADGSPTSIAILFIFCVNVASSGGVWFGYNSLVLAFAAVIIYLCRVSKGPSDSGLTALRQPPLAPSSESPTNGDLR